MVFVDYTGLKVKDNEALRKQCKNEGSEYIAAKKTLLKFGLDKKGIKDLNPKEMKGSIAVVLGYEDEVTPARIVSNFIKEHEAVEILAGVMDSEVMDATKVNDLAKLPSKQELIAKVVGSIGAPLSGFVNVLAGNMRGLVNVLNAVKDQKVE